MLRLFDNIIYIIILALSTCLVSCDKAKKALPIAMSEQDFEREKATDVEILYSDSARVVMRIKSPLMYRYVENRKSIEEFPNGLLVEFLDDRKRVSSWLEADYALRKESDDIILVKENVRLYNKRKEKLETEELIFDSKNNKISTDKFVKITQPMKGDTSIGFGFITDKDFSRFEIKNKYSGTKKIEELEKILDTN